MRHYESSPAQKNRGLFRGVRESLEPLPASPLAGLTSIEMVRDLNNLMRKETARGYRVLRMQEAAGPIGRSILNRKIQKDSHLPDTIANIKAQESVTEAIESAQRNEGRDIVLF
jgi:hypothetical protein